MDEHGDMVGVVWREWEWFVGEMAENMRGVWGGVGWCGVVWGEVVWGGVGWCGVVWGGVGWCGVM